jgi:ATP-dependent RNA helicase HelY
VSVVLYESRRETDERAQVPRGPVLDAIDATLSIWAKLSADEGDRGLALTKEPDLGFVWPMYRWARGESLAKVLASAHGLDGDMPAGDFVRWARQVLDLLGQLSEAGDAEMRKTARLAMGEVRRGVLAYSAVG